MDRHLVRRLDGSGASVREVGGKAASLDRLVAFGFPVPAAFALTSDAYRTFLEAGDLAAFVLGLRGEDLPSPDAIGAETLRVDRAFLEAEMPAAIEVAIREIVRASAGVPALAVRSSATAEDLSGASFAGQYRTFLELKTEDEVLEAVRRCWASLWGPAVRAYRRREGIAEDELAMAVIVQAMSPADWAGVLFTRDPEGDAETARVEAVRGLGEALVSGRVTPHDYRVDRATLHVRGSEGGEPPAFVEDLVRVGLRIERRMGSPQDIEWAVADGRLAVLQTRPITVQRALRPDDDGFDTEPAAEATYTPVGVQEMLPGVVPPLLWTINGPLLEDAFRRLFADLRIPARWAPGPFQAVGRFRGRAALNLSFLREASAWMPGGSRAEVERQFLGRVLTDGEEPRPSGGRLGRGLAGLRALRIRRRVEDEVELFAESVDWVLALGVSLPSLPTGRLLAYRARVRDLAHRGYGAEVAAAAGAAAAYRGLEMALERWVGMEGAATWAQRITAPPAPSGQAGCNCAITLWDLYAGHVSGRSPYAALMAGPPEGAEERISALGEEGERFLAALGAAVRHFGSMAVYGGPTWDEDRAFVWECIVRCGGIGPNAAPQVRLARTGSDRDEALRELLAGLRGSWKWRLGRVLTGQIVDVRGRLLRKLVADATRFLALRERAKAALLVLGGEERRIILEIARRLVTSGHVAQPDDVFLLADGELEEMLLGGEPVSTAEIARRRSALQREQDGEPLPETFEGVPGVEPIPLVSADIFPGWASSPGRIRGRARVLRSLADGRDLREGEVLVARSTDPSWTPLFLVAGGIVLEEGGPLSHAAIVAREFGLPAVLNVKGATRLIATGEDLVVDGTAGLVARAEGEEAA